jgi:hypothetical protein
MTRIFLFVVSIASILPFFREFWGNEMILRKCRCEVDRFFLMKCREMMRLNSDNEKVINIFVLWCSHCESYPIVPYRPNSMRQQLWFAWSKDIQGQLTLSGGPKWTFALCEPFWLFSNLRHYASSSESGKHNSSLVECRWSNCCRLFFLHIDFATFSMIFLQIFTRS